MVGKAQSNLYFNNLNYIALRRKSVYSSFENLPEDKKNKIMDVCIEEFAIHGYQNASTNAIVKNADISKGVLFHYFGNKKNLYLYVIDFIMNYMLGNFPPMLSEKPEDVFEKIVSMSIKKLEIYYDNPKMYEVIVKAFTEPPIGLEKEINERHMKIYNENYSEFFKNLDTSKFRGDIDAQMAIELIMLSTDALGNKYLNLFKGGKMELSLENMKVITNEFFKYIEILKKGIYNVPYGTQSE